MTTRVMLIPAVHFSVECYLCIIFMCDYAFFVTLYLVRNV